MSLTEYPPGDRCRIQLAGSRGRCSTVWVVFSAKRSADLYICPRMLGGAVKVSLHQSGSWKVGLTKQRTEAFPSNFSRHWDTWKAGDDLAPGVVRAWYLLIPDQELRVALKDKIAHQLPPVGAGHAASIEFLMMSDDGPSINFENAHLVGRWRLEGRKESCLVMARRIPWTAEYRNLANSAREKTVAMAEASGIRTVEKHRYYCHGHDAQGVRFGLELAAR